MSLDERALQGSTTAAIAAELGVPFSRAQSMRSTVEAEPVMPGRRLPHWSVLLLLDADGVRNAAIAAAYGVSPAAVSQAMARARRRAAA